MGDPEHAQEVGLGAEGGEEEGDIDIKAALDAHNTFRAKHGAPPLKWDKTCATHAKVAAQNCLKKGGLYHNNHKEFKEGQNLYYSAKGGQPNNAGAKEAVAAWY